MEHDRELVCAMLIPLSPRRMKARSARFQIRLAKEEKGEGYFTCTHWDEQTRLCKIYEDRPRMCREFPNGRVCGHCGETDGAAAS